MKSRTCVGDNQDNDSDTREYIPVRKDTRKLVESSDSDDNRLLRKEIRKIVESSDSDDNSLFEIDIPIKKKPVLPKKTIGKKKKVRRKTKTKY